MKPLKLYIEGLQSFIQKQEIDFESLTSTGLFGIFGNTGSGKSTILDAIMICLYGDIGKKIDNKKDFINTTLNKTNLKLIFKSGNDIYTVERTFKIRNGGSMDNNAFLYKKTADGELTIADNIKNTDIELEKIIGLTFEEFKKCVILPQGEFASFIKSQRSKRLEIIGSLFNLEQYGDNLSKKINLKIYNTDNLINTNEKLIIEIGDINIEQIDNLKEILKKDKEKLAKAENKAEILKNKLKETEKNIKTYDDFLTAQQKYNELSQKKDLNKNNKQKIEILSNALILMPLINDYNSLTNDLSIAKNNLEKATIKLNEEKQNFDNAKKTKTDTEKELEEKGNNLKQKQYKLEALIPDVEELNDKTKAKNTLLLDYKNKTTELKNTQNQKEELKNEIDKIKTEIDFAEKDFENLLQKNYLQGGLDEINDTISYLNTDYKNAVPHFLNKKTEKESVLTKYQITETNYIDFSKIKKQKENLKILEKNLNKLTEKEQKLITEIDSITNKGKELKEVIDKIILKFADNGINENISANIIQNNIDQLKKQYELLKTNKEKAIQNFENISTQINDTNAEIKKDNALITSLKKQTETKKQLLDEKLTEYGYNDIKSVTILNPNKDKIENLKTIVSQFEQDFAVVKNNYKSLKEKAIYVDKEKYNKILQENENQNNLIKELIKNIGINETNLKICKENKEKINHYKKELKSLNNNLNNLQLLKDLIKGKKFMEFAAEEYINEITAIASKHTSHLTGGRFLLIYKESKFFVQDNYNAGVLRSVNTLSGGETFLISLSLAVALSESIVKMSDKPIEFFFLDEGFGTLDRDLCDVVMNILEKLKQTHFTIGVISHVPELMQRLSCRLEVTPPSEEKGSIVKLIK